MRAALLALVIAAAAAGSATAQPINENPPTWTIQCIEVGGQLVPAVCKVPGSRLDPREDICTCPIDGLQVKVPICAKGQTPPPEGRRLNIVRREAARDGSLVGDKIGDRPICAAPRVPLR
ncbi:MAG: hypothetical protein AB1942_11100 [Pseudomonadota bacterium]